MTPITNMGQDGPEGPSLSRIDFYFDDGSMQSFTGKRLKNWEAQIMFALATTAQLIENAKRQQEAQEGEPPAPPAPAQELGKFREAMDKAEEKLRKKS